MNKKPTSELFHIWEYASGVPTHVHAVVVQSSRISGHDSQLAAIKAFGRRERKNGQFSYKVLRPRTSYYRMAGILTRASKVKYYDPKLLQYVPCVSAIAFFEQIGYNAIAGEFYPQPSLPRAFGKVSMIEKGIEAADAGQVSELYEARARWTERQTK